MIDSCLIPQWPVPAGVHALCTSREGGVSAPPWGSLNLGDHVGDDPAAVRANRQLLGQALAARTPGACAVFLQQVHGVDVAVLEPGSAQGQAFDACVTRSAGVVCTIMVADCLPVLLAHRSGAVVGAAHAGWRGLAGMPPGHGDAAPLAGGVLETLFQRFCEEVREEVRAEVRDKVRAEVRSGPATPRSPAPTDAQIAGETLAWLGPCIGPQQFEVGAEVRAAFVAHDAAAARHFSAVAAAQPGPLKYLADLSALARQRLAALGIASIHGNDGGDDWCTVRNASRFFSHRRDAGRLGSSGRLAACIWIG